MEGITENWLVKLSTMGLDAMKIIGDPGLRYLTKGDIRRSIPRVEGSNSALRDPAKSIAKARDFLLAVMNDGKFDNINAGRQTRHRVNNVYVSSSIPSRTEDGRRVSDDSVRARIFGLHVRSGKGALDDQVVFGEFDYLSRYRGSEPAPQSLGQRFFYVPLVKVVDRFDGPDAIDLLRGIAKGLMPDLPRMVVLEEVGLILQESHAEGPHSPTAGE
jgi:hypothetical protein